MTLGAPWLSPAAIVLAAAVLLTAGLLVLAPSAAVFAIVFLGAVLYILHTARRHALSLDRALRSALLLTIAAGLAVPAAVGLREVSSDAVDALLVPDWGLRGLIALTLLVTVGLVLIARAWPARWGERRFVLLVVAAAVGAKLAYVWAIQAEAVSDFGEMWFLASQITERGLWVMRGELAAYSWPHFERVLLYLLPMRLALGPGSAAYSVPNVLLGAATSLLTYSLTRRWFGRTAARVALVLSLATVESVLAAEIPTHDIPGAFFTMLSLLLFATLWDLHSRGRRRAALLAALAFGLSIFLLDLQRSTGPVMLLSMSLLGLAIAAVGDRPPSPVEGGSRKARFGHGVLLLLISLLAFAAADIAVRRAGLRTPREMAAKSAGRGLAAMTDSWGNGTYIHAWDNYIVPYGVDLDWSRLAWIKLASDTHFHPEARLSVYLRKAQHLFPLGTQTYFYLEKAKLFGAGLMRLPGRLLVISYWFTFLFLAALLVALVRIWADPELPWTAYAPLFFVATLSAVLLLVGESQPRYLYPLWYIGSIYIGAPFGRPLAGEEPGSV